jgi:hypothetical protein
LPLTSYIPHPAQVQIHLARNRFRIVCTGRRFGKTLCLAAECLDRAHNEGGTYGWVAPTYGIAERGLEAIREIAGDVVDIVGRAPSVVKIPTKEGGSAKLWILSADNPDSIRGYGFNGLVIDEAASIPPDVWHYVLRPTISQTLGWAVLISTPHGRGYFYEMFTRGRDPDEADYKSFIFPSKDNPYFPMQEWEEAGRTLPRDVFRQEYEAQFIDDSAGVFREVAACLLDQAPTRSGDVAIGLDLAKHSDFTVLIAVDRMTGHALEMERFNTLDWPIQKERILAFAKKWNGLLVMDATGAGDPIFDDLRPLWARIEPVKFTNTGKAHLIQRLIVAIEQKRIAWPAAWTTLTDELQRYEYQITRTGAITYNAPGGYHDDCVIALALANSAVFAPNRLAPADAMHSLPRPAHHSIAPATRTLAFSRRRI